MERIKYGQDINYLNSQFYYLFRAAKVRFICRSDNSHL